MRRVHALMLVLLAIGVLSACGKDKAPVGRHHASRPTTSTATAATTATTRAPVATPRHTKDGCAPIAAAQPRPDGQLRKPRRTLSRRRHFRATLGTNCGTIQISLDVRDFPRTAGSFIRLARGGFYDGLSFHRIAKPGGNDFVIQGGDPRGTGEGGPGYSVTERPPRGISYPLGTVAMAKTANERAGTSGSQFFIVTGEGSALDPVYAIVGHVVAGIGVVRRIAAVPADPVTEMPIDPVIVKKVTIRESRS